MNEDAYIPVASIDDVEDGDIKKIKVEGLTLALFNVEGAYFALDHLCTHEDVSLVDGFVDGFEVECPKHSGRFDIRTGKATAAPCAVDCRSFPIKIVGDQVLVGISGN